MEKAPLPYFTSILTFELSQRPEDQSRKFFQDQFLVCYAHLTYRVLFISFSIPGRTVLTKEGDSATYTFLAQNN